MTYEYSYNQSNTTQKNYYLYKYDKADKWSILDYSKRLLGKTLEEAIAPCQIEEIKGKGRLYPYLAVKFTISPMSGRTSGT